MSRNLALKILSSHLVSGKLSAGKEIGIQIDQTLIHDATGQMALLQYEAIGAGRVKTKRSLTYADHNTLQVSFENMDDHHFLASASRKFGLYYSRAGNGICHQVNLERFSVPGQTLLGADSHTTTAGGVGMMAIGVGGLDVAVAMAGEPFYLMMPEVMNIRLTGSLPPWSSAKDVALEILRRLTVSGGRGKILEFSGEGVKTLRATERATIANMSIETGAITAIFPSDENTRCYFAALDRLQDWTPFAADPEAAYDGEMTIDLDRIEPLVARPHSPDNVAPVASEAGKKIHQVAIGSCTNSSLEDMLRVAAILKGKILPPEMSLIIAPGSRQVLRDLIDSGALADMIGAGARLVETACGFCNGVGQAPRSAGVSLRTSNRNFPGRSGTPDANLYLVSPETAAASAISGKITDPRTLGAPVQVSLPQRFLVDDRMIVPPAPEGETVEILRGPNIHPLPQFGPLPEELEGELLLVLGDNVTTDDIVPAGAQILKLRSNVPAVSEYVFQNIDPSFPARAKASGTGFLLGGRNYGQGSSREHAALCPRYLGIRAVIAESFARIHKSNLINFGILPLELKNADERSAFRPGDKLRMVNLRALIGHRSIIPIQNQTQGKTVEVGLEATPRLAQILHAGGLLSYARAKLTKK
ncbi:MAG: aconitate hydratase [Deltaproteobacteria bacterium SM23_61]|nr:MAG: aconitate hydratase [Deltaproteobacteria bacterium SM23_61]